MAKAMKAPLRSRSGWPWRRTDRLPANARPAAVYRVLGLEQAERSGRGELARDPQLALVEAALLAADEPLPPRRLAQVANLADAAMAKRLVTRLQQLYERDGTAFQVEELAGGYQLLTRPAFHPWLARLRHGGTDLRLTPAARETLAIVAYRQPITRADIEAVRGVQSSEVLRQLMEKELVRISGRDNTLGRPLLYGTTRKFLQLFGLNSLRDLPLVPELSSPSKKPRTGQEGEGSSGQG